MAASTTSMVFLAATAAPGAAVVAKAKDPTMPATLPKVFQGGKNQDRKLQIA